MIIARNSMTTGLVRAIDENPSVALLGPHQVGKTALARELARHRPGTVYLDLERLADQRKLEDAGAFLQAQVGRLTIIDEVHRVPQLFAELRGIIDERRTAGQRTGQFLLLGSASLDLVQHASETLAGRVAYVEMGPITVEEATRAGIEQDALWLRGGFPDSLTARSDSQSFTWRQNFIRFYLERDVPMFAPRMPAATIGRLWTMLANAQGSMLNQARLAQGLGVSAPMIGRYVDLLADLMLVRRLQPWSGNLGKRIVRSPKIYIRDSGLTHALLEIGTLDQLLGHPVAGPSWEGFVIETLIHSAGPSAIPLFYRTADGTEADLVLERGGKPIVAIEIKRSSVPKIGHGFTIACDDLGVANRIVVSSGDETYATKGNITVHSLKSACGTVAELFRPPFS